MVNVENLREEIETIHMHKFGNTVDELLTFIEKKFQNMLDMNATYKSLLYYSTKALLSGPGVDFNRYRKGSRETWIQG